MRYPNNKLDGGLYLSGPLNLMPSGTLRRAKGVHPLSVNSVKSRDGSVLLATRSGIISLTYFNDHWFGCVTNDIYMMNTGNTTGVIIGTNMFDSTSRCTFLAMPPTAGLKDWLFVAGDGNIFKIDTFDTSIVNENYKWTVSAGGTNEYWLTAVDGTDAGLRAPYFCLINDRPIPEATKGSLTSGSWDWADSSGEAGGQGYTVYVRFSAGDTPYDPTSRVDDYVKVGYLYDWGIKDIPDRLPSMTDNASGDLTGTYKYRFTYKNSRTGTRSNAGIGVDENMLLLIDFEGVHTEQTFTDEGYYEFGEASVVNEAFTSNGATELNATTSGYFDGAADAIYYSKDHTDASVLNPGTSEFTIDWWARFDDVSTPDTLFQFSKYEDSSNLFACVVNAAASNSMTINYTRNSIIEFIRSFSITIANDTFYHFAVIRGWNGDPNKWAITQDGTALLTWYYSGSISNYGDFIIGARQTDGTHSHKGYLEGFRFQLGANWTNTFDVPTQPQGTDSVTLASDYTAMTNLPQSSDSQVDTLEIWRTIDSGTAFFKLADVAKGTTTYVDNAADSLLLSEELPTDNLKPYEWFDDAIFHNASCFWLTRTQEGQKGRVYYSPIGRSEAVQGFINVTEDDDPLQKFTTWAGMLIVFSESGVWQILGTNPYTARRIAGVPGVRSGSQYTVITTPYGVFWEATDGVRVFTGGTQSYLLSYDAIKPIFRGLAVGNLSAFTGVTATFARGEYHIADGSQHIAYHIEDKKWRDCSLATDALHYAKDADILGAANATLLYDFENEGEADDGVIDIAFEIEVPMPTEFRPEVDSLCQRVIIDGDTGNEVIECAIVVDGSETDLGDVQHNGRAQSEFPAGLTGTEFSVRLSGNLDAANQCVEIREVAFDIYNPTKGQ